MTTTQVEILHGYNRTHLTFRDSLDLLPPVSGRRYTIENLTDASRARLSRVLSKMRCTIQYDGITPYYRFEPVNEGWLSLRTELAVCRSALAFAHAEKDSAVKTLEARLAKAKAALELADEWFDDDLPVSEYQFTHQQIREALKEL